MMPRMSKVEYAKNGPMSAKTLMKQQTQVHPFPSVAKNSPMISLHFAAQSVYARELGYALILWAIRHIVFHWRRTHVK